MFLNKKGMLDRLYFEAMGLIIAALVFLALIGFVQSVSEGTKTQTDFLARDVANVMTSVQAVPIENTFYYIYNFPEEVKTTINTEKQIVAIGLKTSESSYSYTLNSEKQIISENCNGVKTNHLTISKFQNNIIQIRC